MADDKLIVWLPLTLGEALRVLRVRAKLTPAKLAKLADTVWLRGGFGDEYTEANPLTDHTVKSLEADDKDMPLSQVVAIGEVLGYYFDVRVVKNAEPSTPTAPEPSP